MLSGVTRAATINRWLVLTCFWPRRYGNTSSSTVWYSFGFCEAVTGVKRGDVVWQVCVWCTGEWLTMFACW